MKDLGLLKLNVGEKKRNMNYMKVDQKVYVITSKDSKKINDIRANDQVELIFGKEAVGAKAVVIEDPEQVKSIFDQLTAIDNNHFKQYRRDFVAIEFILNA